VKGDGGLVIVIGGSRAYAAPPYLAALAARRTGVHGVRVAAPPACAAWQAALEAHLMPAAGPELDPLAIRQAAGASAQMTRKLAEAGARGRVTWLFGPGLGGSPQAGEVLDALQEARQADRSAALVVDGSLGGGDQARRRLRVLAPDAVLLNRAEAVSLLPEPGRAPGRGEQADAAALAGLSRQTGAVIVAKGPRDLVTDGARLWAVEAGHPGLARHGSGDVLPASCGGLEWSAPQILDAVRQVALADPAAGWVAATCGPAGAFLSRLDPGTAAELAGNRTVIVGSSLPAGVTESAGAAVRLRGRWPLVSGAPALTLAALAAPAAGPDGSAAVRWWLVPRRDVTMAEDWNAIGLRGGASVTVSCSTLVPPGTASGSPMPRPPTPPCSGTRCTG
jgi:NAD(P)H-hydrate repair Nnr-like enzyme with NAD(P)H-hydrate dehydratase domain